MTLPLARRIVLRRTMDFVRTYDADARSRSPLRHVVSLVRYPALVWQHRYMVQNFLRRDLMSRVNGSVLGIGWLLLQPTFLFAVYYVVFGVLFNARNTTGREDAVYALYLFSGVLAWQAFIEATNACSTLIVDNGNLVKKVAFPSEVLFVHVVVTSLVVYLIGATVCFGVGLASGILAPGWPLLALPLVLLAQFLMTTGLGMLLANAYVFIRDVGQVWRIVASSWMFLSPVFWEPRLLTENMKLPAALSSAIVDWNPTFPLLMAHRLALGAQGEFLGEFWGQLAKAMAWGAGLFVVGYVLFMGRKHKYADLV